MFSRATWVEITGIPVDYGCMESVFATVREMGEVLYYSKSSYNLIQAQSLFVFLEVNDAKQIDFTISAELKNKERVKLWVHEVDNEFDPQEHIDDDGNGSFINGVNQRIRSMEETKEDQGTAEDVNGPVAPENPSSPGKDAPEIPLSPVRGFSTSVKESGYHLTWAANILSPMVLSKTPNSNSNLNLEVYEKYKGSVLKRKAATVPEKEKILLCLFKEESTKI
ncbi:uncharacterized protein [Rutidosis leptorrhynchoides]|uniref:uncharacterized protein isoform X2 n=1 Tax=Rutidosis leptorrhynchoides TaxID=125765 RepID=UPI003A99EB5C